MKSSTSRKVKKKMEQEPCIKKKPRSNVLRRRRSQISPVVCSNLPRKKIGLAILSVDSSGSNRFHEEISCDSSRVSGIRNRKKTMLLDIEKPGAVVTAYERICVSPFRRITRSYLKKKESEMKAKEVEVSESSCVDSNSGVNFGVKVLKFKRGSESVKEIERSEKAVVSVARSEISCVEEVSDVNNLKKSSENKDSNAVSVTSGVLCSEANLCSVIEGCENRALPVIEFSESSKPNGVVEANFAISKSVSDVEHRCKNGSHGSDDLICTEQFCDDISAYSESSISEFQSENFPDNSNLDFSDYTPSLSFDSGSEFSERSYGDSGPSQTYSLFLQYKEQFSRSTAAVDTENSPHLTQQDQPEMVRFEDEDDENSYQRFRERERRDVFWGKFMENLFTTEFGYLVLQQRSDMIHWIVEQCKVKKLQQETMFLSVSILDRFLSRGIFGNEKNLQIVGIACLVLATRIEENQPYNSVQQQKFYVGSNTYSRCEVVAMEWLVQEILNFKCYLPTVYNFLWFYLKAAKFDSQVEKKAKSLAVLELSEHGHLCYWPSTIAAALVILVSIKSNQRSFCQRVIKIHDRTKDNELPECIKSLEWLLPYVN